MPPIRMECSVPLFCATGCVLGQSVESRDAFLVILAHFLGHFTSICASGGHFRSPGTTFLITWNAAGHKVPTKSDFSRFGESFGYRKETIYELWVPFL